MKQLDNYLRITLGLSALVWGASGRVGRWGGLLLTVGGAMKVAEGITGYRPMLQAVASLAMRRKPVQTEKNDAPDETAVGRRTDDTRFNDVQWQPMGPNGSHDSGLR